MTNHDKEEILEQDVLEEMEEELDEIENEEGGIDENKLEDVIEGKVSEVEKYKNMLAKVQADYDNFKKRTDRDKADMIFFLKSDILKKVLPRIDDMERIIENTPVANRNNPIYQGIEALHKAFSKDLKGLGVEMFASKGRVVDPDKHDVMTQAPGKEDIIIDEFEKGYLLEGRVLRHAKVVSGNGQ